MVYNEGSVSPWEEVNDDCGTVYKVNDFTRLMRFLIMGTECGIYNIYKRDREQLTRENIQCIDRLIMKGEGPKMVDIIADVSYDGRAAKQKFAIQALAICARSNNLATKRAAYAVLSDVCRIPTHLFMFVMFCEQESAGTGWGRSHRNAIMQWYNGYEEAKDELKLAKHVTKFKKRHDWSHKDVFKLVHMKSSSPVITFVVVYVVKGLAAAVANIPEDICEEDSASINRIKEYLRAVDTVKHSEDIDEVVNLIHKYKLVREHVLPRMLKHVPIWRALLQDMPMEALVRNLGRMASLEMLLGGTDEEAIVLKKLGDEKQLEDSRLHPFKMLLALKTYQKGSGERGDLVWPRNKNITDALEKSFYKCFKYVKPTGKRYLLAIDISASMDAPVYNSPAITARDTAATMVMVTVKTEENYEVLPFTHGEKLNKLNVTKEDTLETIQKKCKALQFGQTDCSIPMKYALENDKKFDVFVVYTDAETYFGDRHPTKAIRDYREQSGMNHARLIVAGLTSCGFSIADPEDPLMMDMVGFDADAPEVMRHFVMNYGLRKG